LHSEVAGRLEQIERVEIETQEAALRIIDKTGPLANPADRDHCLQYMVAVGLIFGRLTAADYEDGVAGDPRIDALRGRMQVSENPAFSRDYLDPEKRAIGNALQVFFSEGTSTGRSAIDYPIGHRRRRDEGIPKLLEKLRHNLSTHYAGERVERIERTLADAVSFEAMGVPEFVELWVG
jgi:2-methylcitrate dehydratase